LRCSADASVKNAATRRQHRIVRRQAAGNGGGVPEALAKRCCAPPAYGLRVRCTRVRVAATRARGDAALRRPFRGLHPKLPRAVA
jgi:hypothetical protein